MSRYIKKSISFERSFASSENSKFWSRENKLTPDKVYLNSNKKYKFDCNICNHIFEVSLDKINTGRFCPYCVNRKLCGDPSCEICKEKSFASYPKSNLFSEE